MLRRSLRDEGKTTTRALRSVTKEGATRTLATHFNMVGAETETEELLGRDVT